MMATYEEELARAEDAEVVLLPLVAPLVVVEGLGDKLGHRLTAL